MNKANIIPLGYYRLNEACEKLGNAKELLQQLDAGNLKAFIKDSSTGKLQLIANEYWLSDMYYGFGYTKSSTPKYSLKTGNGEYRFDPAPYAPESLYKGMILVNKEQVDSYRQNKNKNISPKQRIDGFAKYRKIIINEFSCAPTVTKDTYDDTVSAFSKIHREASDYAIDNNFPDAYKLETLGGFPSLNKVTLQDGQLKINLYDNKIKSMAKFAVKKIDEMLEEDKQNNNTQQSHKVHSQAPEPIKPLRGGGIKFNRKYDVKVCDDDYIRCITDGTSIVHNLAALAADLSPDDIYKESQYKEDIYNTKTNVGLILDKLLYAINNRKISTLESDFTNILPEFRTVKVLEAVKWLESQKGITVSDKLKVQITETEKSKDDPDHDIISNS